MKTTIPVVTEVQAASEPSGSQQRVVRVRRTRLCFLVIGILSLVNTRISPGRTSQALAFALVVMAMLALYLWSDD